MNQYLDMFMEESRDHLQAINDNLLLLENSPENISIVNEIFRSAHTLKGMAATMGFEDMAHLTHEMENVLDQVRNEKLVVNSSIMDVIFRCVDLLEGMVASIANSGDGRADVSSTVNELKRILSGEKVEPVSTQAAESVHPLPMELDFDEYEITVMQQSKETGHSVYWVKIKIKSDCVLKAVRAYMVYNNLETIGEVIKSNPTVEEIEQEKFGESFELVLVTQKGLEEVRTLVMDVSEIDSAIIENLDSTVLKHTTEVSTIEVVHDEVAVTAEPIAAEEKPKPVDDKAAAPKKTSSKTIRVDIERLDTLMNLFSELVIDRGRLEQLAKDLKNSSLVETVEHMNRVTGSLQNIILTMRMIPVEQVFNRFPRMVRDLSKDLKKNIHLQVEGAETELDRTLIDEIGDPLVHLLRNSIDHGIESPENRLAAGKSENGTIILKAYHSGNHVFIEVRDDGNGINRDRVLKKALEKGIVSEQQAANLSDKQIYELLFASGLSTAEQISDISGRGVGLDVVKTKIESMGGAVSVDSTPGKGTVFLIQLPLTLSIIATMLVKAEEEIYAVPLSSIVETAVYRKDQIMRAHQQDVIDFRGRIVPLIDLKKIFKIELKSASEKDEVAVLIIRKGEKMAALVVDSFIGQQEVVLKSLGKYLLNTFSISGATILGNGQVALIVDCNQLIK